MKILSFQSWHQICSWDEHILCQHPWAPASPCQQASFLWRKTLSVWSAHRLAPETASWAGVGVRDLFAPIQKAGRDVASQVSLAYLSPSSTQSIGDGLRIGSWSFLRVFVLLGIFPPQTKSRIWDETPFISIFGSISALLLFAPLVCPGFFLALWERRVLSCSSLLLSQHSVTSALDGLALPVWKFHVNFMLDWRRKKHRNEWMRQKTELHLKDLIPP